MYYLYSLLTAPGVAVHELGHAFFCLIAGIRIRKIKLFQFGELAGFVVHDEPQKFYQALFISFGPLIINSFIAMILFAKISLNYPGWFHVTGPKGDLSFLWLWLGVAVALHAIPSTGDAQSLFRTSVDRWWWNPLKIIGLPFVGLLYILNFLKKYKIDFVYVAVLFWLGRIYLRG